MEGEFLKRAWIRDANVPVGQPAGGRIDCQCGNAPITEYKERNYIICDCGTIYTWDGWVVIKPPVVSILGKNRKPQEVTFRLLLEQLGLYLNYKLDMEKNKVMATFRYAVGKHLYQVDVFDNGDQSKVRRLL